MARKRKLLMTLDREMLPHVQCVSIAQENVRYSEILEEKKSTILT